MTRLVAAIAFILTVPAAASVSGNPSTVSASSDGSRLLVMRSPMPTMHPEPPITLPNGRVAAIRDLFNKSGVYDAHTLKPIWQVDWYENEFNLRWSDDFRHVVRVHPQALRSDWGLAFFEDGRLLKAYPSHFLMTGLKSHWFVPYTSAGWHSVWCDSVEIDHVRSRVEFSTTRRQFQWNGHTLDLGLQERYTFDLETGVIIKRQITGAWR